MMMSFKQIFARDRRLAAVHEAGHVVIAQWQQLRCMNVRIWPTETVTITDGKTWIGNMSLSPIEPLTEEKIEQLQSGKSIRVGTRKPTKQQRQLIGVAGIVAECCWQGGNVSDIDWYEPDVVSKSDWDFIGCRPGEPNRACLKSAHEVGSLFHRETRVLWPQLVKEGRRLIVDARGFFTAGKSKQHPL